MGRECKHAGSTYQCSSEACVLVASCATAQIPPGMADAARHPAAPPTSPRLARFTSSSAQRPGASLAPTAQVSQAHGAPASAPERYRAASASCTSACASRALAACAHAQRSHRSMSDRVTGAPCTARLRPPSPCRLRTALAVTWRTGPTRDCCLCQHMQRERLLLFHIRHGEGPRRQSLSGKGLCVFDSRSSVSCLWRQVGSTYVIYCFSHDSLW